jgi:tRNA1Val (adenine37-N6)-methyltransferase
MDDVHVILKEGERIDDLLSPSFRIIQHQHQFRFTIDAVLLAHFVQVKKNEMMVDLGTGTGVIPLVIALRQTPRQIVGLEIQTTLVDMARRSVLLNGLGDRIAIEEMDLKEAPTRLGHGIANVVVSNPPYRPLGRGEANILDAVAIARHEVYCTLGDVLKTASQLLKYRGRFYMVHLAERLGDIIAQGRDHQLEAKRIRFVHPFECDEAKLVLVQMIKGAQASLKVMPPIVVYQRPGCYTEEVYRYYYLEEKEQSDE